MALPSWPCGEPLSDLREPFLGLLEIHPADDADEFVSSEADDRFVRANLRPDGRDHVLKQRIPRRVSEDVVDLPEAIDVEERQHQVNTLTAGSIDLVLDRLLPGSSPERSGEVVSMCLPQLLERGSAFLGGQQAIRGGLRSVLGRPGAILGSLGPDLGGVREGDAQRGPTRPHLAFDLGRILVTSIGGAVALLRGPIAVPGGLVPLLRQLTALVRGVRTDPAGLPPYPGALRPFPGALRALGAVGAVRFLLPGMLEQLLV